MTFLEPAQTQSKQQVVPPIPYQEPEWAKAPTEAFHLEVIKQGSIVGESGLITHSKLIIGKTQKKLK
jgi:hypothetical protein